MMNNVTDDHVTDRLSDDCIPPSDDEEFARFTTGKGSESSDQDGGMDIADEDAVINITLDPEPQAEPQPQSDHNDDSEDVDLQLRQLAARVLQQDDSSSDDGSSDNDLPPSLHSDDLLEEVDDNDALADVNAALYPERPMTLVQGPAEYDEDFANDWVLVENNDEGFLDGSPPFTGHQGTTVPGTAPMDFFDFLFRDTMWGELATQTNAYAVSRLERLGPDAVARMDNPDFRRHARLNLWKAVTAEDMRIFAAHLIVLGLVKKPELEEYWSRKTLTQTPFFGRFMPRDRFQMILSNFHIADDSQNPAYGRPGHDPLAKLQPFIQMILETFHAAYKAGPNISVDEGCCPWKGRLRFKLYNPRKPAKFHIKLFQVCDPSTGYVLHFSIYTGKGSCHRLGETSDDTDTTVTTKTVMTVCADANVLDTGRCIYFDNFFTSFQLLQELFMRQTLGCGTSRPRQQGPLALQSKTPQLKLEEGESCAYRSGPILAFKWRQKKPKTVYMMSTKHTAVEQFTGKFDRGTGEAIYKPAAVIEYTKQMGGVDLSDQLMNYYHFLRRSCKWWRKLWVHLFNMLMLNAHVLNKTFGLQKNLSHHEYRYIVAAALLNFTEMEVPLPPAGGDAAQARIRPARRGHWPERLAASTKTKKTKTRKCRFCFVSAKKAARGVRTRREKSTSIICSECRVPLCIYPCFGEHHIAMNLNQ